MQRRCNFTVKKGHKNPAAQYRMLDIMSDVTRLAVNNEIPVVTNLLEAFNNNNNNRRNGSFFNVAGYLKEERRRWPVITASPRGQHSK